MEGVIYLFRRVSLREQIRRERDRSARLVSNNVDLGIEATEREINEIIMAMQVSEMEIKIMEMGAM